MNPPDKIVLTHYDLQWLSETHQIIDPGTQSYEATFSGNTYEYHLAPVWHDAKTDPPKEDGDYFVVAEDGLSTYQYKIIHEKYGLWYWWGDQQTIPSYWMPLPEPPKVTE